MEKQEHVNKVKVDKFTRIFALSVLTTLLLGLVVILTLSKKIGFTIEALGTLTATIIFLSYARKIIGKKKDMDKKDQTKIMLYLIYVGFVGVFITVFCLYRAFY